ncbi:MAG: hypothetical protein HETSPECPRED_006425 [Heterodermia speciosa]|uniref:GH64 domain-containing protein n=1 Tax=Heterodermia speciosa TaxID=116794 RepID=A0A8H3FLJ0_9LECA|nr:MAG: hypothetical protein HETSPECPRED_006425 [Heterodermia speciosa]
MTASTLNISLQNQTGSSTVYAYITGQALDNNNNVVLLQSDGRTLYFPTSPPSTGASLATDCAIALGPPGSTTPATIPRIAGGRIWFSINAKLTFLLNPGPSGSTSAALVEPSPLNPSDPNIDIEWDFCEFTFNEAQLFVNITYVDFVSIPIALTLRNTAGKSQHITGTAADGLDAVCAALKEQASADNNPSWSSLIVSKPGGGNLRALSPNHAPDPSDFQGYYQSYVDAVYSKYANTPLTIDTQASYGLVSGTVINGSLDFGTGGQFAKPSTADIFSCSTGPFQDTSGERAALVPRIAAAFNRSTLLIETTTPSANSTLYYQTLPTNHYARIVHSVNLDGRGYAFPYDDVTPTGGQDQSGAVFDSSPQLLTVTVGGANAGNALSTQL